LNLLRLTLCSNLFEFHTHEMAKGKGHRCKKIRSQRRSESTDTKAHISTTQETMSSTPSRRCRKKNCESVLPVQRPTFDIDFQKYQIRQFENNLQDDDYILMIERINHLLHLEKCYTVPFDYLSHIVTDITSSTRAVIVDYVVRFCEKFKFSNETLFLTISLMDRFLSSVSKAVPVSKDKLKNVAVTCLIIAAKYQEVRVPNIDEFVQLCGELTRQDILRMETLILNTLTFTLTVATICSFLPINYKHWECDEKIKFMAEYLCELALQDYGSLMFSPSLIAFSSVHIAKYINAVYNGMRHDSTSFQAISPCSKHLLMCAGNAPRSRLTAIMKKYSSGEKYYVALVITDVIHKHIENG
jgi:transcription initiation factor TFIIIB Brf1 subunit/transcription initiation factor TFIIB